MVETPDSDRGQPKSEVPQEQQLAQGPPRSVRSYDEMNTGTMVFEMQGTIGELKQAVAMLDTRLQKGEQRIEAIERAAGDIKDQLAKLAPKIDDVVGFIKHGAPNLASKTDLASLRADLTGEIEKRPTRRQAIIDIAWVVGLITAAITFGSHFAH